MISGLVILVLTLISLFLLWKNHSESKQFSLDKLQLPSRHYYFSEQENYIKLLNIGEGVFPKDKIRTSLVLDNSNLILTTESATKIYPSKKEFGINKIDLQLLNNSNLEFINDELILYKDSKYLYKKKLNFHRFLD